jgi:oligopeptide/dipeptide ABC transporter ATP-binding protein
MTNAMRTENLLAVSGLSIAFQNNGTPVPAVRDLDLTMKKGEVMGLVGESGSGKSVTALAIAGLLHASSKVQVRGSVAFNGRDHSAVAKGHPRQPGKVAMIFQDPFDSLNPAFTVGYQIQEVFRVQKGLKKRDARIRAVDMLGKVKIPSPATVAAQYPHQLSGGMCQRVMIAMALAAEPELLIADEPTTALDVTIQAQILQLLYTLYRDTGTSILFITHDLGVVAQFCHSVAIMLEGEIVERGSTSAIFKHPLHPYTRGLLNSIPIIGRQGRLQPMASSGDGDRTNDGCGYHPRCPMKSEGCCTIRPSLMEHSAGHFVRCIAGKGKEL